MLESLLLKLELLLLKQRIYLGTHGKSWLHISANIYLFKFTNRNTRKKCNLYSKLIIKTKERCLYDIMDVIWILIRSSHRRCSIRKSFLRNLAKFTGKLLCQSLFFNKVAGLRSATLLKKRLWQRCFLVNFAKFLRTPFSQNTSGRLLLSYAHSIQIVCPLGWWIWKRVGKFKSMTYPGYKLFCIFFPIFSLLPENKTMS